MICRYQLLMIAALLFLSTAFSGCAAQADTKNADGRLQIVTTIFAPCDFARAIAAEHADVTMLLPPGAESHTFEPTPQDIIKIQNCDLFIYTGGVTDVWAADILNSLNTENLRTLKLLDCVETVAEEIVEGMETEDEPAHNEQASAELDEHVWTSPKNAALIVQEISDAICEIDAENAGDYTKNTTGELAALAALDAEFAQIASEAARKTIVFGDRFPFRYFADAYGLSYFAAFPGCAAETEPSAATVAFLIDKINAEKIPVVFHQEMSDGKMAETVSEATGAKIRLFHACHNVSKEELAAGATYLSLMRQNAEALKEALY
ncbi:MAG: metal ABC transporter substrate-binding protein [Clostridiales bacterium]|jgi:zinc transport system substrate-binding protein|nr:metal ABC transporter substrate-binding protein [Clostridiales bacterium]